jgi:hypothetical protein
MAMDYAVLGGIPYLVTLDANSSAVRVYDVSDPAAPALRVTGNATAYTGSATDPNPNNTNPAPSNGNAVGQVRFGPIDSTAGTAVIYAMSTNQGIQSLTLTFPGAGPSFVLGDFNFDGGVDASDIDPFVLAANEGDPFEAYIAASQSAFEALYPGQTLTSTIVNQIGDINGDGGLDSSDIDPFVPFANNGGARVSAIPEPAALGLLAPMGLLLARRRR